MARLRKWDIKTNGRWPHAAANYTNDLIYARLAPGVLEELKKVNSKDSKGKRKGKLFQGLTKDIGHPKLIEHIAGAVALMKANDNWDMFMLMMGKVYPKYEDRQYEFDF
jgi:hypothetical protein